ncbi:threonine dehydrogenase [Mycobacterium mantenii]|uniref:Theronine dehydrogenase n=1 Tax=Mycobacterium mantenii TaxID=560555 RepID=A0A1X0FM59_MYCNT|nr:2,3-butanediol dehydrogenase [Mycobacterium mantenii]MCV7246526.1 2,3-butanediol dehydrogenase [Mycobacterium mantenii]ORB02836.1 theronine dehydrogenase [Mycobacterium mantenii]BBY38038.1 threonine dehydrogenase [Mycobacterium mantenii]
MQALRWHANNDLRLEEVPTPDAGPHDVVIEVSACGICGTDLHEFQHGPNMIRHTPHPLSGVTPPLTLGHEFSGHVVSVGDTITDLQVGQLVTVDPCLRCGSCPSCLRGDYHLCTKGGSVGLASDGAFASHVLVPRVNVLPVPAGVPAEWAAVAEPLAVGLHAATRADVGPGDVVLITGGGPIGIASLLGALSRGAAAVYVSEPLPERAELARRFGATEAFDPTTTDVRREVFLRSGRVGPDAAIEATGRPEAFELAITAVRRGGRVSIVGISDQRLDVDLRQVVLFERSVLGALGYHHDIERVLKLMATGRLDPQPFITDVRPLESAIDTFVQLATSPADQLKVLLTPKG